MENNIWFKTMSDKNYKPIKLKDNTYAFTDFQGNVYFNNNRMKSSNGQMSDYDYKSLNGNALTGEDLENWKTAMRRLRYKEITLPDGSTAFQESNGTTYFNNGRKLDKSEPIFGSNPNKGKTIDYDITTRVKQGKSFRESDSGKSQNNWFANSIIGMAYHDQPHVWTATGWRKKESGDFVQDKVDDPGVVKLRNNLAVLGAGVTAGIAAPVVGPAVVSEAVALKPFLPQIGKNMVAGMFGADVFNATTRAITGQSFDDYMVTQTPIKDLPIGQEWKYMIGGTANPGGWLGFGTMNQFGHQVANGINKGVNFIGNTTNKGINWLDRHSNRSLTRANKYINGEKRVKDFNKRFFDDYYTPTSDILNRLYKLQQHTITNPNELLSYQKQNYKDINQRLFNLLEKYRLMQQNRRISKQVPFNFKLRYATEPNITKVLDPIYNTNAAYFQEGLYNKDGIFYLPWQHSLYNVKTGTFELPVFGSDKKLSFTIQEQPSNGLLSLTDESLINATSPSYTVPTDYKNALQHNIDYISQQIPGVKVFGSADGVINADLPHATHDIDFYITQESLQNFEKSLGRELPYKIPGLTKTYQLDGGRYGDAGDIDLNIIATKPDGTLDFTSERSLNLFRQLYPGEYQKAYLAAKGDLNKMHHPIKAQELLDQLSVKNTIMDAFESSKDKHKSRALYYLNRGNVDQVYEALLQHGKSFAGQNMLHAPVTEQSFLDPKQNLELLKRLNLTGLENLEKIANDPKRMRNVFEYWWQNNTIVSRGTSIENMPEGLAREKGIPHQRDFEKYAIRNATQWSGGIGGSGSGTGLNTVYFGDSGGGVNGNDIYVQMQPELYGYKEGLSPNELIDLVRSNYPNRFENLKTPIEFNGNTLESYNDLLKLGSRITPEQLDQLSKLLKIRGIVGGNYGGSTYVGVTSPVDPTNLFINPAYGRHGQYISPTNASQRRLNFKPELPEKFKKLSRFNKHHQAYEKQYPRYTSHIDIALNDLYTRLKDAQNANFSIYTDANNALYKDIDQLRYLLDIRFPNQRQQINNRFNHNINKSKNNIKKWGTIVGLPASIFGLLEFIPQSITEQIQQYYSIYDFTPEQEQRLNEVEARVKLQYLKKWEEENKLKFKQKYEK